MDSEKQLHIVMFPWLAIGHLIPFHHLSKCLAQRGHKISFISTPRNIDRLPKTPSHLSHLIRFISFPLPKVENLPENAESSMDIPHQKAQFLKIAFDNLESTLVDFLENSDPTPDWIIYDYASHWLPKIALNLKISSAYFSLFTAATMAFIGPPSIILSSGAETSVVEAYTAVPNWIPFQSDVVYRPHDLLKYAEGSDGNESGTSDTTRFGLSVDGCDVVLFRTCVEFEPEWFELVCELYRKPVISIGVLPPEPEADEMEWTEIREWLDEKRVNSVIYVALGTEATLSHSELTELAIGLEKSELPFFWVLRNQPWSTQNYSEMLPMGFKDRVRNRAVVCTEWVPQVKILGHPALAGFLTHCGWNSIIEGLCCGRVLIMFPVMNDQGLNARLLAGKKVGVEIPRNEQDGYFTSESVTKSLKLAVLSQEGEPLRANARKMKEIFSNENRNRSYIDNFVSYLTKNKTIYGLKMNNAQYNKASVKM